MLTVFKFTHPLCDNPFLNFAKEQHQDFLSTVFRMYYIRQFENGDICSFLGLWHLNDLHDFSETKDRHAENQAVGAVSGPAGSPWAWSTVLAHILVSSPL